MKGFFTIASYLQDNKLGFKDFPVWSKIGKGVD
jgi:uncharacterized membrane protein YhdT